MSSEKIAIIDLDSACFTIAHPNKILDENEVPIRINGKFVYKEKTPDQMLSTADNLMTTILSQSESTHYIGYIKGKGNYRYAINSDYKANRPKESPYWWRTVKEYLISRWGAAEVNGIEVDDAVRITVKNLPNSFICAIDNDLLYLEGTNYNWRKDKWITISKEEAEYKFWSDMITGQAGDNIKGIPGKGPKAAQKIMEGVKCPPARILKNYIEYFGENKGIIEFYKNYSSLHILDHYEGFVIPEIIKFNKNVEELF